MAKKQGAIKLVVILLCGALLSGSMGLELLATNGDDEITLPESSAGTVVTDDTDDDADIDEDLEGVDNTIPEEPDDAAEEQPVQEDPADKYNDQIDNLTDKLNENKKAQEALKSQIADVKDEKKGVQSEAFYIDQQIGLTRQEISLLEERIDLLEQDIAQKELDILQKQDDYDSYFTEFQQRMRALYMTDNGTTIGLLVGSDSFSGFLSNAVYTSKIAEYDQNLMENMLSEKAALEDAREALKERKDTLLEDKQSVEQVKAGLDSQLAQANMKIQDIEEQERQYNADLEQKKKEALAMQAELDRIYQQIEWEKSPYVGGEMGWPVSPGFTMISSEYGPRWGTDYHTGIDITGAGIHGTGIFAVNDGTVKFVQRNYTHGRDYGMYLIVDHGGGITTLYAHCSAIVVSVGQQVKRGEKIAEVGSTGWSTGPHLHLEVRINGKHTNPRPYIFA